MPTMRPALPFQETVFHEPCCGTPVVYRQCELVRGHETLMTWLPATLVQLTAKVHLRWPGPYEEPWVVSRAYGHTKTVHEREDGTLCSCGA